jgi:RHS repeat-associated protein
LKFRSDSDGLITGVRFYKGGALNGGTHVGHLWTSDGTLLGSVTFTNETESGWQQALFPTPIPITANTTYVISYFAPQGRYAADNNYFASTGVDNGQLHALSNAVAGGNGVYHQSPTGGFPTDTFESSNYWVDVVFTTGASGSDTTPPTVSSFAPAAGATNVNPNADVIVVFNEAMNPATVNTSTVELRGPSNALVAATVSYDAVTFAVTLNPSAPLAAGVTYTARVRGGGADPRVKDAAGNALAADLTWTFTTAQSGAIPLDGLANLTYNEANNRITTPGFEYDPAGNQIRAVVNDGGTQQQYRYDSAGRLAQVLDAGGNVLATYSYGAGNQRLKSVEGSVTKYFAWAGGQTIAEYEALGTNALVWKTSYVYLGGQLLATTTGNDGNETRFHHPDRLGTRLVTDAGGAVVSEQFTLPFGNMLPFTQNYGGENPYQNPAIGNPSKKRFTTYDRSEATGLDYAVNRFYSPQQGRFTQVDPIGMGAAVLGDPQTLNMYAYCGNDPINGVDPDGLFFGKVFGWIGKAFKFLFKVAAVALFVAAVIVHPGLAGTLLMLGIAGWAGLAGWHNGKLGKIAGLTLTAGLAWKGNARTPGTFPGGTGVGGVNSFVGQQDPPIREIPQEYLDIVSEEWSLLEDGTVLYEATMNVTDCISWNCVWSAIKRGVKIGAKKGVNNVFGSPAAFASAILFRGKPLKKKDVQKGVSYLYQKLGPKGEHLKYGITNNPFTRYTSAELGGGNLKILASGTREKMLDLERKLHENLPLGPEEAQLFYIQKQIEKGLKP